ncbi:MAG TPA: DUF1036 domain-containing protein [Rhizomicrobium sp.]|nr:DUF1036 domain-containing protein [Rhizomicrobium sp.]
MMRGAAWVLVMACLACTSPAQAALNLCNRTSYILYAATSSMGSGSATHGWIRIAPGDCQLALPEKLTAQSYLVYARSSLAYSGPQRAWGGNFPSCVTEGDFTLHQSVPAPYCAGGQAYSVPFAVVDTHKRADWTMTFDDQPAYPTLEAAQLAGVKRLLKDNGYKIVAIDGKPSKSTEIALNDFRKAMHFSTQAGNVELFAALENQARKRGQAPQGYTVCNDDKNDMAAAVAQLEHGTMVSRGWWRVAGGACARLITAPLDQAAIWLLVERPGGAALVTGPDQFCVNTEKFEIKGRDQCHKRGLAQAGFARTPTAGVNGRIVHVDATGILPQGAMPK